MHADGEIWCATNFDIRRLLNDGYGAVEAHRQRSARTASGPPTSVREPALDAALLRRDGAHAGRAVVLDAGNAILAADVMRFGGANQDLLWLGFARRGFGENATARER